MPHTRHTAIGLLRMRSAGKHIWHEKHNKDQSNLAIGGIAANCGGPGSLPNTVLLGSWNHMRVPAKWHLIPSNGFSRVHECDRRYAYTDGQTTLR